jgi:hypothetical protein
MKANELMVGNYIQDYYNTKILVVKTVDSTLEYLDLSDSKKHSNHITNLKPIPLTEDILLKCGFEKQLAGQFQTADCGYHPTCFYFILDGYNDFGRGYKQPIHKYNFCLVNISKIDFKLRFQFSGYKTEGVKIEHLHQLQNLYFCLCGEELTIKL